MDPLFKIYVDQLRDGTTEQIKATFPPGFIGQNDEELAFDRDVEVFGEAYLADQELILHLNASTEAVVPCSICNGPVRFLIELKNFYHAEELANVKSGIFCFDEVLREALMVEAPHFIECSGGQCPSRREYDRFFHQPEEGAHRVMEEGYQPFKDLSLS